MYGRFSKSELGHHASKGTNKTLAHNTFYVFCFIDNTCDRVGTAEGSKSSQSLGSIGTQTRPAETLERLLELMR